MRNGGGDVTRTLQEEVWFRALFTRRGRFRRLDPQSSWDVANIHVVAYDFGFVEEMCRFQINNNSNLRCYKLVKLEISKTSTISCI
jgi:hypothetical protein